MARRRRLVLATRLPLLVLVLVLVLVLAGAASGSATKSAVRKEEPQWLCVTFFSAPTDYCVAAFQAIASRCGTTVFDSGQQYNASRPKASKLIVGKPSQLLLSADGDHIGPSPKVVVPSQDPLEIILSSFAYHNQLPEAEAWMTLPDFPVCPEPNQLQREINIIGTHYGNQSAVLEWVQSIAHHCRWAVSVFRPNQCYGDLLRHSIAMMHPLRAGRQERVELYRRSLPRYKHVWQLHGNDLYPAIRLEAFRLVPEFLVLAAAKLRGPHVSTLVVPHDAAGDVGGSRWEAAAAQVASYLMRESPDAARCSVCACLRDDATVTRLIANATATATHALRSSGRKSSTQVAPSAISTLGALFGRQPSSSQPKASPVLLQTNTSMRSFYLRRARKDAVVTQLLEVVRDILVGPVSPPSPRSAQKSK